MNKKQIYAKYGIKFENGKIEAPLFGFINPLLINGNAKLGKGVWTFSTLAGTEMYHVNIGTKEKPDYMDIKGTCLCDCAGCYAKTGFFRMNSTIKSLAIKTALARLYMDFVKRAIIAQIEADKIEYCRIHASGEFFNMDYVDMWKEVCTACENCHFWTYTKNREAEQAFDNVKNANIVKSIVPGIGLNFGHCDHVINAYEKLNESGKSVHICKCGVDKNQHCTNCKGCSENEYVLFLEHSTSYKPEADSNWEAFKALVDSLNK